MAECFRWPAEEIFAGYVRPQTRLGGDLRIRFGDFPHREDFVKTVKITKSQ